MLRSSNKIVVDTTYSPKESDVGVIIPAGQEIATVGPRQVAIPANSLQSKYDITNFVSVPTGPFVPPVVDPNNFDHFKLYVKDKLCYNSAILDTAVVGERKERMAFRVDMWSLMEHRSVTPKERPYDGESVPGKRCGNLFDWKDLDIETPSTIIKRQSTASCPLEETQKKQKCPLCNMEGKQKCSSCHGKGQITKKDHISQCSRCRGEGEIECSRCKSAAYLLVYDQMNFTWHTEHSVGYYQNTFLPNKIIKEMPNKPTYFDGTCEWTNHIFLTNYKELFRVIVEDSPVRFEKGIQQQYQDNHFIKLQDSSVMCRLKCLIRYIEVLETDYQLESYINKTERNKGTNKFTYLQYSQDGKGRPLIYENDYPLNCCGCLGPKAGCSCNCTIL